jgi:MoaA/NifB/PqqE/SkfB family radical SAM enzyme
MVSAAEVARRASSRMTGKLQSLPILALSVHSACNCRCVMCDIWKGNARKREISPETLASHVNAIRALNVQRVMLTGGEPLLNRDVWMLCALLQGEGIAVTLVTTGLLLETHAEDIAHHVDTVVVSLDGPREIHDEIRRVPGGFAKIEQGLLALKRHEAQPRLIARTVVQKSNFRHLSATIAAARQLGFDEISFLGADLSSKAFNRPDPWSEERRAEVAVPAEDLDAFEAEIDDVRSGDCRAIEAGFVAGGLESLVRIHHYYAAIAGRGRFPAVRCNAPWVSAVLEPDGTVRPCFFHDAYPTEPGDFAATLNSPRAIAFRKSLDVATNPTCQRCVCSLNLPLTSNV